MTTSATSTTALLQRGLRLAVTSLLTALVAAPGAASDHLVQTCSDKGGSQCASAIPDKAIGGVISTFEVDHCDSILDLNVQLDIDHPWAGDLRAVLRSPEGTFVQLMNQPGVSGNSFGCEFSSMNATLDDEAPSNVEDACNDDLGGTVEAISGSLRSDQTLAAFDNQRGNGLWSLRLSDYAAGDEGTMVDWSLELDCSLRDVDLQLGLEAEPEMPVAGGSVSLNYQLDNLGNDEALGVRVVQPLPAELQFVSSTCATREDDEGIQWFVGTLEALGQVTCQVTLSILSDVQGALALAATAVTADTDLASNNDQASLVIEVLPTAVFGDGYEGAGLAAWSRTVGGLP